MAAALDLAEAYEQRQRSTLNCVNSVPLIIEEHQGTVQAGKIEADQVEHLVGKSEVVRQFDGLDIVRLEPEGAPDARDYSLAHTDLSDHGACRPMRRLRGPRLDRVHDQRLGDLIDDLT